MSSHKDHKNELTLKELEDALELVQDITIPSGGGRGMLLRMGPTQHPGRRKQGRPPAGLMLNSRRSRR